MGSLLKVPLKERSKAGGRVEAYFVVDHDRIVGAYMALEGYVPGIVSLAERDMFSVAK